MKTYIFFFETDADAKSVFSILKKTSSKKMFRFKKGNDNCIAVYCNGIKSATLLMMIAKNLQKMCSELVPDFGYYCEVEKVQVLEMANV